ncbi:MAG: YkgJ family cysteine cluster protein [Alphaproteobacteria bacterium]|nr:YkgJ family cysteine cluster protein [Alphaproteobacteria bacterium]
MKVSKCDTCRKSGNCCKGFILNFPVNAERWKDEASDWMKAYDLPFEPVRAIPSFDFDGKVGVVYDCTKIGSDGRCTIYEDRPHLCRIYEPGQDGICAEFVPSFKNIPIVVLHC